MSTKQFTLAGTSVLNGVKTFRFATGKVNVRTAKLKRHSHTDVELRELPKPMSKEEAVTWLASQGISDAVVPTNRKGKPIELTAEQKKAAAAAAKREAANAARREARKKAKEAAVAADDAKFLAETGIDANAGDAVPEKEAAAAAAEQAAQDAEAAAAAAETATTEQPAQEPVAA